MNELVPSVSPGRQSSRLVASPSRQVPQESVSEIPLDGENIIVEQFLARRKSSRARLTSRASHKSLDIISSASEEGNKEEESSGDNIESSELYDAKAQSSSHSSSASSKPSILLKSAASQTPIADRFSANAPDTTYGDITYSSARDVEDDHIDIIKKSIDRNILEHQKMAAREAAKVLAKRSGKNLAQDTSVGTPESVYIVGEDFDSSSEEEEIGQKEEGPNKDSADELEFAHDPATLYHYSRLKVALILLSILFAVSLGFNIYTGYAYYTAVIKPPLEPPFPSPTAQPPGNLMDQFTGYERITKEDPEVRRLLDDPNLRRIFYGIDYAPLNVQYPSCGSTQRDVTLDIAILSQLTDKIRLYGTDCHQADFVLNAIRDLDVNMTLSLGVWIDKSYEGSRRQMADMKRIVSAYPSKYIDSILIGNEVLFRQDMSQEELISHIESARAFLRLKDIDIPVGTSEIGAKWNAELASHVDVLAANIHPFFGGVPVNVSTKWTYQFLYEQILADMSEWDVVPSKIVISEVGWPSGGGRLWGSVAGLKELQVLLDDWVCSGEKTENVGWYWFEAFDEPWKVIFHTQDQKWETQWGLFNSNRRLKDGITLPTCEKRSVLKNKT